MLYHQFTSVYIMLPLHDFYVFALLKLFQGIIYVFQRVYFRLKKEVLFFLLELFLLNQNSLRNILSLLFKTFVQNYCEFDSIPIV